MNLVQTTGVLVALAGLIGLLLPGISAPPILGAILMLGAGVSWGIYSLRGRGVVDATRETAGNFFRAVPFALLISVGTLEGIAITHRSVIKSTIRELNAHSRTPIDHEKRRTYS